MDKKKQIHIFFCIHKQCGICHQRQKPQPQTLPMLTPTMQSRLVGKNRNICAHLWFLLYSLNTSLWTAHMFVLPVSLVKPLFSSFFFTRKAKLTKGEVPTFQGFSIHTNEAIKAHCRNQIAQLYQLFRNYCIHLNEALKAHVVNVGHGKVWFSSWAG